MGRRVLTKYKLDQLYPGQTEVWRRLFGRGRRREGRLPCLPRRRIGQDLNRRQGVRCHEGRRRRWHQHPPLLQEIPRIRQGERRRRQTRRRRPQTTHLRTARRRLHDTPYGGRRGGIQEAVLKVHHNGINPDGIEAIYKKAHAAIRANPVREAQKDKKVTKKRLTDKKLTSEARKQKVKDQKEEFLAQMEAQ